MTRSVRNVFESEPGGGIHRKGRPSQRWADQVTKNVTTQACRDVWRRNLAKAKICNRSDL